jgi:hypothetical protein
MASRDEGALVLDDQAIPLSTTVLQGLTKMREVSEQARIHPCEPVQRAQEWIKVLEAEYARAKDGDRA